MTSSTYLFAGASSAIAIETARLLKEKGHTVLGISTHSMDDSYAIHYPIENYSFGKFPTIEETLDGIVYFPGTITLKPFARITQEDLMRDLEINTIGAFAFAQTYLPNLKKSTHGSMVFVSSVAASTGLPFHASISTAKAALEGLTKALASELAPSIRVNAIAPSLVDSPLAGNLLNSPEKIEQMQKRNPLRKIGTTNDIANAISFLLSKESAWITGQTLAVDGGMNQLKNG